MPVPFRRPEFRTKLTISVRSLVYLLRDGGSAFETARRALSNVYRRSTVPEKTKQYRGDEHRE